MAIAQAKEPPSATQARGQLSVLDLQRRERIRQRDAMDSVFSCCLLPLIPGLVMLMAAPKSMVAAEQGNSCRCGYSPGR